MSYLTQTKNTQNFLEVLVRDHERYMPIIQFLDNLTQQSSELTWEERELISLEVSNLNGAKFCAAIHNGLLNSFENKDEKIRNHKMEPVLAFVRKLVTTSNEISQNDIDELRMSGWNDQTIEDIIGLASAITVYDMLANGFGFKDSLPESVFQDMGKGTIEAGGFVPQFKSFIE